MADFWCDSSDSSDDNDNSDKLEDLYKLRDATNQCIEVLEKSLKNVEAQLATIHPLRGKLYKMTQMQRK